MTIEKSFSQQGLSMVWSGIGIGIAVWYVTKVDSNLGFISDFFCYLFENYILPFSLNQSSFFLFFFLFYMSTELIFFICYTNSNTLCGYQRAVAWDMLKVYGNFIEAQERRRYVASINLGKEVVRSCKLCHVACYMIGWWVLAYFILHHPIGSQLKFCLFVKTSLKDLFCHFLRSPACIC